MESQETQAEKSGRRKLKRIVKKKAKVLHNGSSSVAYYKKVKAALNASLNSSKVRQSLQANNKALAQSLQNVKQELRFVLNENACLKLELHDLNIKLLRVQNRERISGEQSDLERRLHGMKMLLHQISSHMLGVGTCIDEGIDLCHLTPRTSRTCTSRPASMSVFTTADPQDNLDAAQENGGGVSSVSDGLDTTEIEDPTAAELYSEHGDMGPVPLSLAAPDMSVILEQSILMDDGQQSDLHSMEPVLEEAVDSTMKPSSIRKLPQRVRNVASSSSSDESDLSVKRSRLPSRKANLTTSSKTESSSVSTNQLSQRDTFTLETPTGSSRRDTFVVSRTALVSSEEYSEGIDSVEMPDLVAGISTLEDGHSPKADQPAVQILQDDISKSRSSSPKISQEDKSKSNPVHEKTKSADLSSTTHKNTSQKKEDAPRSAKSATSFKKPAPVLLPSKSNKKDEAGFFIMNPCSLNLVHQRNTGSNDGCISSGKTEQVKKSSSVDQFLASIKDSNSRSRKIASLSPSAKLKQGEEADQETQGVVAAVVDKPLGTDVDQETPDDTSVADTADQTTYFSVDMDFTEILPPVQSLETMAEEDLGVESRPKDFEHTQEENQCKDSAAGDMPVKRARTKPRSKPASSKKNMTQDREGAESDSDGTNALKVEEKKLPVAMRLGKAGQMVFAAARKEEDGSRKAVPAKPARSKSKKKMEEMLKNLPNEEPKSVFDFHDRTPRQTEDKPKAPASVFDISLDESCVGSVSSLASFREKFAVLTKEIQIQQSQKTNSCTSTENSFATKALTDTAPASLLGDAPEYRLPLKGKDCDSEPERVSRSRGRSASRGRAQSRSKSRSKAGGEGDEDAGKITDPSTKHGRSRSRKKAEDEDADFEVGKSRGRSRSRRRESLKDLGTETVQTEEPRRSARSKSNARKAYVEEDSSLSLELEDSIVDTVQVEGKSSVENRSRSKSRHKHDEDDDYKVKPRPQQRGRSRCKKGGLAANVESSDKQEAKPESGTEDLSATLPKEVDKTHKDTMCCLNQDHSEKSASLEGDTTDKEEAAKSRQKSSRKSRSKSAKTIDSGEESSAVVSDAALPSNVTDRRHRSRSAHKRLYSESDADDVFGLLSAPTIDTDLVMNSVDASDDAEKRKSKRRTRSRCEALHQKTDINQKESEDTTRAENIKSVAPEFQQVSAETVSSVLVDHKLKGASEIRDKHKDMNSKNDTPDDKSVKHSEDTATARKTSHQGLTSEVEGTEDSRLAGGKRSLSKSEVNSVDRPPVPVKKGKSNLQPVDSQDDIVRVKSSAAPNNPRNMKSSEVAKADSSISEKNKNALQFEEVKRKLQEIESRSLRLDEDPVPRSAKKSRPLVLPALTSVAAATTSASSSKSLTSFASKQQDGKAKPVTARSKKVSKSQHGSPKDKKATKSQPCSPKEKKTSSKLQPGSPKEKMTVAKSQPDSPKGRKSGATHTSPDSSPTPSVRNSLQLSKDDESGADIRRGRRAAAAVSYKEPSLHVKLRRGDPFTTFLHKEEQLHVYKSPKGSRKHSKSGRLEREVFTDLTNMSFAEVEVESKACD